MVVRDTCRVAEDLVEGDGDEVRADPAEVQRRSRNEGGRIEKNPESGSSRNLDPILDRKFLAAKVRHRRKNSQVRSRKCSGFGGHDSLEVGAGNGDNFGAGSGGDLSESDGRGVALVNVHEGAAAAVVAVVAAADVTAIVAASAVVAADVTAAAALISVVAVVAVVTFTVVTVFVVPLEVLCHEFHAGRCIGGEDHLRSVSSIA